MVFAIDDADGTGAVWLCLKTTNRNSNTWRKWCFSKDEDFHLLLAEWACPYTTLSISPSTRLRFINQKWLMDRLVKFRIQCRICVYNVQYSLFTHCFISWKSIKLSWMFQRCVWWSDCGNERSNDIEIRTPHIYVSYMWALCMLLFFF